MTRTLFVRIHCYIVKNIIDILYTNRQAQTFHSFFLRLCASHEKFVHTVRKVVFCRFPETYYNLHQPSGPWPRGFLALEDFKDNFFCYFYSLDLIVMYSQHLFII
jgi:hypothetical protein